MGKSTFINQIAGRKGAKAENRPGVTRGKQWVTVDSGLLLLTELRHIAGGKFLLRHTDSSSTTGQWSLPSTSVRISDETTRGSSRSETIK